MIALIATLALAQEVPDANVQLFRPALDARATLWTDDSGGDPSGETRARGLFHYAWQPVVYVAGDGTRTPVVTDLLQLDLTLAHTWRNLRFGAYVPALLRATSPLIGGQTGLGDLGVEVRGTALDRADGLGLAFQGRLHLPTATVDGVGSRGVGFEGSVIADKEWGDTHLAANLGYHALPTAALEGMSWDDQVVLRLGVGQRLSEDLGASLDLASQVNVGGGGGLPVEALVGGWGRVAGGLVLRAGAGAGLTRGFGAPRMRVVFGVGWEPAQVPDTDRDGLVDARDGCVDVAEDLDGDRDADGCPEGTMVTVVVVDEAGNPIAGGKWRLGEAGGVSGETAELFGGTYEASAWASGHHTVSMPVPIADQPAQDIVLTAPALPGSLVVLVRDVQGAPIQGASVAVMEEEGSFSPGEARELPRGRYRVVASAAGFQPIVRAVALEPEQQVQLDMVLVANKKVEVSTERIDLKEAVFFETGKATILPESYPLLDQVASILLEHPELLRIRIEGHTDSRGRMADNQVLSQDRADSVLAYLLERGVEAERLEAVGYGETRPLDDRETRAAWAKNRRVDILIVERRVLQ